MTREEAKLILSVYRGGKEDAAEPFFLEALKLASEDAELAKWFAAEQVFDAQVTASLDADEPPAGLKAALLATIQPSPRTQWTLPRALALAGATAAIAVLLTLWVTRNQTVAPGGRLADFRAEMISFLLPEPRLTLNTRDLTQIKTWLAQNELPSDVNIPAGLRKLPPLGCRTFIFRGHKVGLLCFRRSDGKEVHLLVVNRAAFDPATLPKERAIAPEGEWMTAAWVERDQLYLLAAQGDQSALGQFL